MFNLASKSKQRKCTVFKYQERPAVAKWIAVD